MVSEWKRRRMVICEEAGDDGLEERKKGEREREGGREGEETV